MNRTARFFFLVIAFTLLPVGLCFAAPGPMETAQHTVETVIGILKTPALAPEVKRERLSTTIGNSFDFEAMSQRILAQNWKNASSKERDRFIDLLAELLQQNYLGHIESYTNEKIEFVKERIKRNKAAIDTLILTKSKEIPVSYHMLQNGEGWKVYDVIIESVSFVNNYRRTYGQIIKKEGFSGLLAKMEEKLTQLHQENQGQ